VCLPGEKPRPVLDGIGRRQAGDDGGRRGGERAAARRAPVVERDSCWCVPRPASWPMRHVAVLRVLFPRPFSRSGLITRPFV
jgi:hypothetical protein